MNIEKVILNVTLKGEDNQWEEGVVLYPPLPHEILDEIKLERDTVRVVYGKKELSSPQVYSGVSNIKTTSPVSRVKRVKR